MSNLSSIGSSEVAQGASLVGSGSRGGAVAPLQSGAAPLGQSKVADLLGPGAEVRASMSGAAKLFSAYVAASGRNLSVSVDESAGAVVIKVVDSDSGDLIRQIPSEEILSLLRYFNEQGQGALLSQKA